MTWNSLEPRLEPQVTVKNLPLPLLLPALSILTAPTPDLEEELTRQLGTSVLATVLPPARVNHVSAEDTGPEQLSSGERMEDVLARQLYLLPALRDFSRHTVALLLQCLDSRGYIHEESMRSFLDSTGLSAADMEPLLLQIQDWVDPPGLFAWDLVDCLLIQLRREGLRGNDPWRVLTEGQAHLARGDLPGLGQTLGWSPGRLAQAMDMIRRLDPRPGNRFEPSVPVIPEISFETTPTGTELHVRLLHENLPRFTLEEDLLAYVDQPPFTEQWSSLKKLMTALALRLRTKLRTARLLAERQKAYILGDTHSPAPLVLQDLARPLGYHPSTIQRALGTTWARSPRGTLCLSTLPPRPLRARPDLSVAQFRQAIIEGRKNMKSDSQLARELGIPRRTLAWHRRQIGL